MGTLSNWMARAGYADGSFYVIGSHGHPRDNDHKLDAVEIAAHIAAKVVRIRLKPGSGEELRENDALDVEASSKLRPIIAAQPDLAPFLGERLENNGLTIEGVAVLGDILYADFRGPGVR
jgi:hypothetical protein